MREVLCEMEWLSSMSASPTAAVVVAAGIFTPPVIPANGICPKQPLAVFSQGDLRNFVFSNQILVFETPKY